MTEKVNEETGEVTTDLVEYDPNNPVSIYMNGSVFHQVGLVAKTMAMSELVPVHLRNKPADCFLIVAQAVRWGMDPFAVAQSCYVASGKVGYEGKLIAGLINAKLSKKLDYEYKGEGVSRTVRVSGTLKGENKSRTITGSFSDWHTKAKGGGNTSAQWSKAPDQMLAYRGAREWARRHMPEAVLGIYSDDEVQEIERTEAVEKIDGVLDELLDPAKVVNEDDPPEIDRPASKPSPPPKEEEEAPKPVKAKKVAKKRYARPAAEADRKKPNPGSVAVDTEPEPDPADTDDEIDALFS